MSLGVRSAGAAQRLRRSIPRQAVAWTAKIRSTEGPGDHWIECMVTDISPAGAGVTMLQESSVPFSGTVEIVVELRAEIRNSNPRRRHRRSRVGVEFVELPELGEAIVQSLRGLGAHW